MQQSRSLAYWLCIGWVVLVVLWVGWEAYSYSGLYRWLAEWQIERWGEYQQFWTALGPLVLLTMFPLSWIGRQERARKAQVDAATIAETGAPPDPLDQLVRTRRFGLLFSGLAALVAVGAYGWSQTLPDASDPPAEIDLATLGDGDVPAGPVLLTAAIDTENSVTQQSSYSRVGSSDEISYATLYVPLIAEGAAKEGERAPVRVFLDRSVSNPTMPQGGARQVFMGNQFRGTLVENGLPGPVRAEFENAGIAIASPHYLLTSDSAGGRKPFYITAAIAGLLAFAMLAMVPAMQLRIWRERRQRRD
ncbi:hypothetical protein [Parasphingopyxis marina]|uniref:Uncharacterized protein n=1 Tax=Parasphingopyxis marina TaxID=2761622 RepID=A0A842HRF6_9SPHN|nr:hypothetical protein [Parasphingopyxis marina]MBC2776378.1 hypothetical protein [Parasphingopyxis marina]